MATRRRAPRRMQVARRRSRSEQTERLERVYGRSNRGGHNPDRGRAESSRLIV